MTEISPQDLGPRGGELLARVVAGERIAIVQGGVVVARLVALNAAAGEAKPVRKRMKAKRMGRRRAQGTAPRKVDWTKSAAFALDHTGSRVLSHEEVMELLGRTPFNPQEG